jgi:hypothetical protein
MAEADDPVAVADLPDQDLSRLVGEAREALRSGIPFTRGIRNYGIEDAGALRQWVAELEAELSRRGLSSS